MLQYIEKIKYFTESKFSMKKLSLKIKNQNQFKIIFIPLMLVASCLLFYVITYTKFTLGIPNEWTWSRFNVDSYPWNYLLIALSFLFFAVIIACFIDRQYIRRIKKQELFIAIAMIISFSTISDYFILKAGRYGMMENIFGVMDKYSSGYLTEAYSVNNLNIYLKNFHNRLDKDSNVSTRRGHVY